MERENPMQVMYRQREERRNLHKLVMLILLKVLVVKSIQKPHYDRLVSTTPILHSHICHLILAGLFFVSDT